MSIDADIARMLDLRRDLFTAIKRQLEIDGHCKSYEGTFSVVMPSYFGDAHGADVAGGWLVRLDCYVIGPSRHYEWSGATLAEAVDKAERDVRAWILEAQEDAVE